MQTEQCVFGFVDEEPPLMVAYGAGVDSTAMLLGMKDRGIRPDAILFADVGGEKPQTYDYLKVMESWCLAAGFPELVTVKLPPTDGVHGRYATLEENCLVNQTMPSIVFGRRGCSVKWKHVPQDAWAKTWEPARRCWSIGRRVVKAIGYDNGPKDCRRPHIPDDDLFTYVYPLRDWGWDREACEARIRAEGLSVPMKSSCFFCPEMKPDEIRALEPSLLRRIMRLEAAADLRQTERRLDGQSAMPGLWRAPVKGTRGASRRPGSMTELILGERLLEEFHDVVVDPWWMRDDGSFDTNRKLRLVELLERLERGSDVTVG